MIRIGQGIDVHPFQEDRPLVLGGVRIADRRGLAGHSDADAVLHALTDALLGSVAAGDIGAHFPSSDPKWRDADSRLFVAGALDAVARAGFRVVNVDVTIVAETPKLAQQMEPIRSSIAAMLGIESGRVGVKATTTDHLGFVGRNEGIAALAVVLVESLDRS
ncbi:MAG TPA: 2-C-methyl-D-erythritol 2,4-cyclodiphosphate synthase [Thermoanaerobaculia bacterium]|nr:2-C-methyl-D-erythritol 2,4-cyclodiphosphate synthase [Thermoanaerobaculia bacterium]